MIVACMGQIWHRGACLGTARAGVGRPSGGAEFTNLVGMNIIYNEAYTPPTCIKYYNKCTLQSRCKPEAYTFSPPTCMMYCKNALYHRGVSLSWCRY